jgi:hypothetical protein
MCVRSTNGHHVQSLGNNATASVAGMWYLMIISWSWMKKTPEQTMWFKIAADLFQNSWWRHNQVLLQYENQLEPTWQLPQSFLAVRRKVLQRDFNYFGDMLYSRKAVTIGHIYPQTRMNRTQTTKGHLQTTVSMNTRATRRLWPPRGSYLLVARNGSK